MSRLLALLLGVLALAWAATPAHAQDCGNTGTGAFSIAGFNDFQDGQSCVTGANGAGYTVNNCQIRITTAAGNLRCAIYDNTADPNKALLCQAGPQATTTGINTLTLSGCGTLSASTTYWISFNTSSATTAYTAGVAGCASGITDFFVASTFGAAPSPWGTRTSETCDLRMWMNLTAVSGGRGLFRPAEPVTGTGIGGAFFRTVPD